MNYLNLFKNPTVSLRSNSFFSMILLAGLLAVASPLRADNPPTFLFQWGSQGTNNGQFNGPNDIAIDSSNNVYVPDQNNSRIEKFDGNGNFLTQWGSFGSGNGQFEYPDGIAVDSSNNVYVADGFNYRVEKFDGNGNYLTQWGSLGTGNGQFEQPDAIAVDNSNNVYVVDPGNSRIEKFDSNGNYLTQLGSYGTGNGQFNGPNGIAIDSSNNVYVVDTTNQRVEKFDRNGTYLTRWGSAGTGNGQFEFPEGVAVDSSNHVYVVDFYNTRIEKFTSNGNYLTQWGSQGSGNGQFSEPGGIAVDSTGNFIYVADSGNDRIKVFVSNPNIVAPIITNQPASQTVPAGANVTFSVGVIGTAPFAYQWSSNSIAISSATNATFTLTDVSFADSASYSVLVTNSYGSELRSNAVLTVLPAVVITQPASSVTTTGAVLNGSVTLGSDETVVWFEWGTDTNYGNIADETVVQGNNGSNNISTVLNGLPGNIFHYRIDAANNFGIIYGNDQSFTVGLAPTATTLAAINSTNGTTFDATVNPNGWDTTVYFKWGTSISFLTNSTPVMDVGAGAASLNVSSFIPGLVPFKQYAYQVVASNHLGTVSGAQAAFYSFPFVSVLDENWDWVASSADGSVLVAVANEANGASPAGSIIISSNSGATWAIATGAPTNGFWETVACSADGSRMLAAGGGGDTFRGPIYTSADMGVTWVSNNAPFIIWQSVASSADGTRLVAAAEFNQVIYTSTNSGAVWTHATNAPKVSWFSVALSADGTKLAAVAIGSTNIFTSSDFGTTWITNNVPRGPQGVQVNWSSIASSADGSKLIAAAGGGGNSGYIFVSTNSGAVWQLTATNIVSGLVAHPWISVASSADGSKLAAVSDQTGPSGVVITSTNSGATWTTNAVPFLTWNAVALSADGAKLVATVGYPSTGPIYVSQTTPSPVLNLSASDNGTAISWLIPSLDFTLQQSPDLMNWTDVTNPPVLNLTNLQNQVTLPPPDGNSFLRLKH